MTNILALDLVLYFSVSVHLPSYWQRYSAKETDQFGVEAPITDFNLV